MAPSCRKCRDHYGPGPKVPLSLQCGHTFCKSCLTVLENSDSLRCPICRRPHTWPPVSDIPVNEELLETPSREEKGNGGTQEDRKQLLQAAEAGQVEKVLRLIWKGVAVDTVSPREEDEGRRPLHLAADTGHENVVWALLQAKASPNILDNEGMAPIHLAAWGGHLAAVTILLMHGADPQIKAKGRTALHWGSVGGHVPVLRELLHHCPSTLHLPSADHHTPLHLAADNGNLRAVKWLVAEGADTQLKDARGRTALHLAREERHKDVVNFLSLNAPKLPPRPTPQPRTQPPQAKPSRGPHQEEDDDEEDDHDDVDDDEDEDDDGQKNIYEEVDEAPVVTRREQLTTFPTHREQVTTFQKQQRDVAREIEERARMGEDRGRMEEERMEQATAAAMKKRNAERWEEKETVEERRQGEQEETNKKVSFNCPPKDDDDDDEDDDEEDEEEDDCDYTITEWLGQGDFGSDFLVQRNGMTQVLKKIELRNIPSRSREQVGQELDILQRISHPHIVDSLGGEVRNNIVFLFTEHCPGGNLAERIRHVKNRNKTFSDHLILMWTVSLAQALSYLHNNNVMHRNLKPENLFLGEAGAVLKVGNFSFARFMKEDMATTYIGSPVYMSPEIIMGQRYDTKADMWSMGCILYELIKLERGYPYNNVKLPSYVDKKFRSVVKDLLNKEPSKRPSASALLNRAVFKATLQEKTVREQRVGEMRRASDHHD